MLDHDRRRVVWAGKGKSGATVDRFLALLGRDRAAQLEIVSIDMSAYEAAVRLSGQKAEIVSKAYGRRGHPASITPRG